MPELISPLEMTEETFATGEDESASRTELEAVRDLVLRAHPDVVPELVRGHSVAELLSSVEDARAAYARLEVAWDERRPAIPAVPAGGGAVLPVDPDTLPPTEKIRRGLQAAGRRRA